MQPSTSKISGLYLLGHKVQRMHIAGQLQPHAAQVLLLLVGQLRHRRCQASTWTWHMLSNLSRLPSCLHCCRRTAACRGEVVEQPVSGCMGAHTFQMMAASRLDTAMCTALSSSGSGLAVVPKLT